MLRGYLGMKVILGGKTVDFDLNKGRKIYLQDVVIEVENFLFSVGKIPNALSINGKSLSQSELDTQGDYEIASDTELDFKIIDITQYLGVLISECKDANQELINKIAEATQELEKGEFKMAWVDMLNLLENFFNFWIKVHKLIPQYIERVRIKEKSFETYISSSLNYCREIFKALEEGDKALAGDLLNNELVLCIEEMNQAIPILDNKLKEVTV